MAQVHAQLGENDQAIEQAQRVLKARPDDLQMRILAAQTLVRQRKVDEGLAILLEVPEADRDAETLYALGRIQMLKGDAVKAREMLLAANAKKPGHSEILRYLLELDHREGKSAESVERIEKAAEEHPDDARLVHLRGLAYLAANRARDAEASLRKAIELAPNDLAPYQSLARLLSATGRQAEMLSTYERALQQRPDSPDMHFIVGTLYEASGDLEKAMERYESAVKLNPDFGVAKNNLAYLLAEQGRDLDRALDLAQEAKALLPDNANAADTLGWVLHKKGVPGAAVNYLKEAVSGLEADDVSLALVRHHLALAYEANGEPDKALETLESALADLDAVLAGQAERTGQKVEPPGWAADLRSMRDRLKSTAPPAASAETSG
jgi:tetratricopeptide (TPR) repeat protein